MTLHPEATYWRTVKRFKTLENDFKIKHNNFYSYDKSVYFNAKTNITITCPIHGDFEQLPTHHLKGVKCPSCSYEEYGIKRRLTNQEFIEKSINLFGNFYDYSKTFYVKGDEDVVVICKIHGEFTIKAENHLQGCPCPKCSSKVIKTTESFIKEASEKHSNKYTYPNTIYLKDSQKLEINCSVHGPFWQTPNNHLKGSGCPICGGSSLKTNEQFIKDSIEVHGNVYNYTDTLYIKDNLPVTIKCEIHGEFTQKANSHLRRHGCPECAITGFDKSKPAVLYYLSINNGKAYKIGITNRTVKERFGSDMKHIQVLHQVHYSIGKDAYEEEQRILKEFKQFQYKGPDLLKSGNTELFTKDILNG